ncbi:MAG TPA: SLC13 family permease, partial [Gemmatales bacterium]|nr:SLC13 family permease [Gemmatales bacterium]
MNYQLASVLGLLLVAMVLFTRNKPRMDAVALIMLAALPFTGVLTMDEALAGFSNANVVLIAALFVLGDGLVRTGVARILGDWLISRAGHSETRLVAALMITVCVLGSTMSSTAITAIFIPVVLRIGQVLGSPPSRLFMPLSFAALISGMMTLVATAPNLVVNSELIRSGYPGLGFFSFTPFGVPILILGIVYMSFARHWLTPAATEKGASSQQPRLADWIEFYQLGQREFRLRVMFGSPLVGKTLEELDVRGDSGANIVAIERRRGFSTTLRQPTPKTELLADDVLLVDLHGGSEGVDALCTRARLQMLPLTDAYFSDRSQEIGMAEVIVVAGSDLIDKTLVEAGFRTRTGLTVIGIRRGRAALAGSLLEVKLRLGDTLLVVGPWRQIERLRPENTGVLLLSLPTERRDVLPAPGRAWQAVACLLLVVGLMVSGLVPNVQAALIGCLLMGACRCIDLNSAYRAIYWKTIVLIVGMMPFSLALQRTGGVELMVDGLMTVVGGAGLHVILACLFILTTGFGLFVS